MTSNFDKITNNSYSKCSDVYKEIFESIPCYISVQNRNLKIIANNKMFSRDFEINLNSYCYEIYKKRSLPCNSCPVVLTFKDGLSRSTEDVVVTKHGKSINVIIWTSPLYDNDNIVAVVEMFTDITSIRQFQDRLTSIGLMVGSISHGLRSMLTSLDGGLYKFETGIAKEDQSRILSSFEHIKQASTQIKNTILEVLYYTKLRQFNYSKLNIIKFLKSVLENFKEISKQNQILISLKSFIDPEETIMAESNWLRMAISNLFENSVDACLQDKLKTKHYIDIEIKYNNKKNNYLEISIIDNGIGMTEEVKNKAFTLFFSSKGSKGTGLGLFTANQIISQHKGSVTIKTKYQKGTDILIQLPLEMVN